MVNSRYETRLSNASVSRRRAIAPRPAGFTLVELLIVIGVIVLLIALLIPMLSSAQESARRAACLNNVRQLVGAVTSYINDNQQMLPDAASVNDPLESALCPRNQVLPAWTPLGPNKYVLPSIGGLLAGYLGSDTKVWKCPSAGGDLFAIEGQNPYWGTASPDRFRPNYNYSAGKEVFDNAKLGGPIAAQFKLREWAARNISGLPMAQAIPLGQTPAQVVVFQDRESTYHTNAHTGIYTAVRDGDYYASYGYLDGHVEGHHYRNATQYLSTIHHAIPQVWFGQDFQKVFPEQYQ